MDDRQRIADLLRKRTDSILQNQILRFPTSQTKFYVSRENVLKTLTIPLTKVTPFIARQLSNMLTAANSMEVMACQYLHYRIESNQTLWAGGFTLRISMGGCIGAFIYLIWIRDNVSSAFVPFVMFWSNMCTYSVLAHFRFGCVYRDCSSGWCWFTCNTSKWIRMWQFCSVNYPHQFA